MAADDGRAFARPARPHGVNLGGCFRWRESALPQENASGYFGSTPPEGEKFPRKAFLFSITPPTNPPVPATSPCFSHY